MADNFPLTPGSGRLSATDQVTYSGDTADVQLVKVVQVDGSEGAKTVSDLPELLAGSGSLTGSGQAVTLTLMGQANATFQLTGTWSATITFEASNDNSNWEAIFAMRAGDNIIATTATTNDIYRCTTAGFKYVRARCSAFTSGTVVVTAYASTRTSGVFLNIPLPAGENLIGKVGSNIVMCQTTVTRPADTTAYAANDALSDSTTTPTTGGFTFTSAARLSGGAGIITDLMVTSNNDPGTQLQGELFIFDRAVTNINDNAAFAVTDAEIQTCVAKIPFTLEDVGNNGFYHAQNLNIGFVCNGSANLRFLVRVKNAYTPASAEVVTFTLKVMQA